MDTPPAEYDSTEDLIVMYAWMEKLIPLTDIPEQQARQLLFDVGINYKGEMALDHTLAHQFELSDIRKKYRQTTPNHQFKQALRLLEPMIRKFGSDLHVDNFMCRITPDGPQLVIIDPLYPDA